MIQMIHSFRMNLCFLKNLLTQMNLSIPSYPKTRHFRRSLNYPNFLSIHSTRKIQKSRMYLCYLMNLLTRNFLKIRPTPNFQMTQTYPSTRKIH